MAATLDLVLSVIALIGLVWSVRRLLTGRAAGSRLVTINVALVCLLVLIYQAMTPVAGTL